MFHAVIDALWLISSLTIGHPIAAEDVLSYLLYRAGQKFQAESVFNDIMECTLFLT